MPEIEKQDEKSSSTDTVIVPGNVATTFSNVGPSMALSEIKSTDKGIVLGGYMVLWGDPDNRDAQMDYFTPETEFYLDHYSKAPALFQHGQDPIIGKGVLGYRDDARKDADGLWVQDWIDTSNEYFGIVRALLDAGKLYYSPGSVPHLVDRTDDRQLKAYPIVDDTFTPTPAQFALGMEGRSLDFIKSVYTDAGQEFTLPEALRGKPGNGLTGEGEQERQIALAKLRLKKARLHL